MRCATCDVQLISIPEQPLSQGTTCKWCQILALKKEVAILKVALVRIRDAMNSADQWGEEFMDETYRKIFESVDL